MNPTLFDETTTSADDTAFIVEYRANVVAAKVSYKIANESAQTDLRPSGPLIVNLGLMVSGDYVSLSAFHEMPHVKGIIPKRCLVSGYGCILRYMVYRKQTNHYMLKYDLYNV